MAFRRLKTIMERKLRLFLLDDDLIQNDIMTEYLTLIDIPLMPVFFYRWHRNDGTY